MITRTRSHDLWQNMVTPDQKKSVHHYAAESVFYSARDTARQ